jgi:hypothetical protein
MFATDFMVSGCVEKKSSTTEKCPLEWTQMRHPEQNRLPTPYLTRSWESQGRNEVRPFRGL